MGGKCASLVSWVVEMKFKAVRSSATRYLYAMFVSVGECVCMSVYLCVIAHVPEFMCMRLFTLLAA